MRRLTLLVALLVLGACGARGTGQSPVTAEPTAPAATPSPATPAAPAVPTAPAAAPSPATPTAPAVPTAPAAAPSPATPSEVNLPPHVLTSAAPSVSLERTTFEVRGVAARAFAVSPNYPEDRSLWAAGADGQLYRSVDGGSTWEGQPLDKIEQIVVSPAYPQDRTLFAGGLADRGHGLLNTAVVYRSTDGGATWAEVTAMDVEDWIQGMQIVLSPTYAQDQTLFAFSHGVGGSMGDMIVGSLHRSTDGGTTWEGLEHPCVPTALAFSPSYQSHPTLYLGCAVTVGKSTSYRSGLARSANGGNGWTVLHYDPVDWLALLPSPEGQILYSDYIPYPTNRRSPDGGVTWHEYGPALGRIEAIIASPDYAVDATWLAVAGVGEEGSRTYNLLRSTDAGASWEVVAALGAGGGPFTISATPGAQPGALQVLVRSGMTIWRGALSRSRPAREPTATPRPRASILPPRRRTKRAAATLRGTQTIGSPATFNRFRR